MRSALACLLLIALHAGAQAKVLTQSVTVLYLDGSASQEVGGKSSVLSIGDSVSMDASLKLDEHSMMQLTVQGSTLTLVQPGTYSIRNLAAAQLSLRRAGAGSAVAAAFSRILSGPAKSVSAAGGVRAEIAEPSVEPSEEKKWEDAHAQGPMDEGRRLLAEGQYGPAIEQFFQATTVAEGSDAEDAEFYLASAYALNGDPRNAIVALAAVSPTGTEEWAKDYVLLRAKLLEDTFAPSAAVDVLLTQGADLASDQTRAQTWFFLLALGYRGTGDAAQEKACLDKVVSMGPGSALDTAAARLRLNPQFQAGTLSRHLRAFPDRPPTRIPPRASEKRKKRKEVALCANS